MATYVVTGDQYRAVDRKMNEIKRQLNQTDGSPLDPEDVAFRLQLIVEPSAEYSVTPEEAAQIMGLKAFHGLEVAEQDFGVRFSRREERVLSRVPFSAQRLKAFRNTHILVAVPPLSIMDIQAKMVGSFYFKDDLFKDDLVWYAKKRFALGLPQVGWYLIRKRPVAGSLSKNWAEQQLLLTSSELTPNACMMVYAIRAHYLATGEHLLPNVYVRTDSWDEDGNRVLVGHIDNPDDGLHLYRDRGVVSAHLIGIAAHQRYGSPVY